MEISQQIEKLLLGDVQLDRHIQRMWLQKPFFSSENQVITRNCLISIYSSVQLFQWTFSFCWQSNFILCRKTVPQRVRPVSCHRKSLQSLPIQAKLYLKKSGSSYRAAEGRKTILQTQTPFPIWLCIVCYQGPAMPAIKKSLLPYCGSPELFFSSQTWCCTQPDCPVSYVGQIDFVFLTT